MYMYSIMVLYNKRMYGVESKSDLNFVNSERADSKLKYPVCRLAQFGEKLQNRFFSHQPEDRQYLWETVSLCYPYQPSP
jgi:hypothetical protein